jgi:hypothetical protein
MMGIPTGGTAPKGYITENGPDYDLRDIFGLSESTSSGYSARTRKNVYDSTGTVLFGFMSSPGSKQTIRDCDFFSRPYKTNVTPRQLADWIVQSHIEILNVAGNRASKNPQVAGDTIYVVTTAISLLREISINENLG